MRQWGGVYDGKPLGSIGLLGTFSTFFAHHICTMEGGMAMTDDQELYEYMLCIRSHGWTRNLPRSSEIHKPNADPFYEKFNFVVPGFNIRPLEMEGSIGNEQLKKMDGIIARRRENAAYIRGRLGEIPGIRLQKEVGQASWYGFGMVLEGEYASKRSQIVAGLEEHGIETRPIAAGNFTRSNAIKYIEHRTPHSLDNSDELQDSGFYIGNHPVLIHDKIDYFVDTLKNIMQDLR